MVPTIVVLRSVAYLDDTTLAKDPRMVYIPTSMSRGWDPRQDFSAKCNTGTVDLESVDEDEDIVELREMIELHKEYTGSTVAAAILDEWPMSLQQFVKVMPTDYKRVLAERKRHDEEMEATVRDDETGTFAAHAR